MEKNSTEYRAYLEQNIIQIELNLKLCEDELSDYKDEAAKLHQMVTYLRDCYEELVVKLGLPRNPDKWGNVGLDDHKDILKLIDSLYGQRSRDKK